MEKLIARQNIDLLKLQSQFSAIRKYQADSLQQKLQYLVPEFGKSFLWQIKR